MLGRWLRLLTALTVLALTTTGIVVVSPQLAAAQSTERRAKVKVRPTFPELARRLKLSGTVRVEVTIAPDGTVTAAKPMGGHPVLIEPAVSAAKKWRFEPGSGTTTEVIPFEFRQDDLN